MDNVRIFLGDYFLASLIEQKEKKLNHCYLIEFFIFPAIFFWRLFGVGELCNDEFGYFSMLT